MHMSRNNYQFDKRQRELRKKLKKEEKRQRKEEHPPEAGQVPDVHNAPSANAG